MNTKDWNLLKQRYFDKSIHNKNYIFLLGKYLENRKEMITKQLKGKAIYFN